MSLIKQAIIALLITLCCQSMAFAKIYKWTDADGVVHYSSTPKSPDHEVIKVQPSPPAPEQQTPTVDREAEKRQEQFEQAEQQAQQEAQQYQEQVAEACVKYKENLTTLQETGRRVYTVDAKGDYHYLSPEERQKEIDYVQSNIDKHCQP